MEDITDHLPTVALLKQTKLLDKEPIQFESRNLSDEKIAAIKHTLDQIDWNGELNKEDQDLNFE